MQNNFFFLVLGVPTFGVDLVGPNSQIFPKIRFEGFPYDVSNQYDMLWHIHVTNKYENYDGLCHQQPTKVRVGNSDKDKEAGVNTFHFFFFKSSCF